MIYICFLIYISAMRVIIQRALSASVEIEKKVIGSIHSGLLVFLGIEEGDDESDIEWLTRKIVNMRIFNDSSGVMNLSVRETGGDILVISQFTLFASTKKGNRPSYIRAACPDTAIPLYQGFIEHLSLDLGKKVSTGKFGAMMTVNLINDGPVTLILDSRNKE